MIQHTLAFERRVQSQLAEIEHAGMRRVLHAPRGVNLSSNDYLGLSTHPLVKQRMADTVWREGCGSTGSRLLSGQRESFTKVERRFAKWKGTEAALFLGSGYLANLAVLSSFLEEGDTVFSDELNHASLIDGMRLSKAQKVIFRHCDVDDLARLLERSYGPGQKFVVTESIFSMDGDEALLAEYAVLCRATNTVLIVDEAHAVGIAGVRGTGLIEETGVAEDVFLSINPAGKALGVGGAFVAGPRWAIDYMIQRARPFIFSTAPPPAMAEALDAAIAVIGSDPERRMRLLHLSIHLRELMIERGIQVGRGCSQIIPIVIGDTEQAATVAEVLQIRGYDVRVIRPPSVPPGTSRLRISVSVNLKEPILEEFSAALAETLEEYSVALA